ncbi:uncharacterized protein PAN0_003d1714 [Moesziomyces antarcticus]|uniref:Uncharacterized protein n=1 Tax=Pseudozyma antarctica TaxID=84753 RepID=A0A5C3FJZ6_PSEA2|nr:uncharacterized protein PAN0_003d1714 [Moesziomyces antarcticus]GAK63509.1 hypothetical protein PAN0_003d1714 [Moesziomyces antarcticus]SPO44095.1 uncharacterized protein PSANT_01780 [Moesziomyces antarcticus]
MPTWPEPQQQETNEGDVTAVRETVLQQPSDRPGAYTGGCGVCSRLHLLRRGSGVELRRRNWRKRPDDVILPLKVSGFKLRRQELGATAGSRSTLVGTKAIWNALESGGSLAWLFCLALHPARSPARLRGRKAAPMKKRQRGGLLKRGAAGGNGVQRQPSQIDKLNLRTALLPLAPPFRLEHAVIRRRRLCFGLGLIVFGGRRRLALTLVGLADDVSRNARHEAPSSRQRPRPALASVDAAHKSDPPSASSRSVRLKLPCSPRAASSPSLTPTVLTSQHGHFACAPCSFSGCSGPG